MLWSALLLPLLAAPAQPNLAAIQTKMDALCEKFDGKAGYCLKIMPDGPMISRLGNRKFPTASTIKTAIMIEAINQVDEGKLKWTDVKEVPKTAERTPNMSSMWAYFLRDGVKINLDGWCNLMITYSDNTATKVVGMWVGNQAIYDRMKSFGLDNTAFLSYAPSDQTFFRRWNMRYGMGMTTPIEMAKLYELIYKGKVASEAGTERIQRILGRQYWDDFIAGAAPPDVRVLSKSGAISRSRSDNGIVYGRHHYVLTLYTDDQADRRWASDNAGDVLLQQLSSIAWNGLHPERPYTPPKNADKFAPTGGGIE